MISPSAASLADGRRRYPVGKVVGALQPGSVEAVTAALADAGFAADQIEVVTAATVTGLLTPLDRTGPPGFVGRFLLSMGDDLDELETARQELDDGHTLIFVPIPGAEARQRARDVLRDHGGHAIRYFGHWTITPLD